MKALILRSRAQRGVSKGGPRAIRSPAQKRRDRRIGFELPQLRRARQLRLVALRVDHAEEAERLAPGGAELVPGHGRHGDEVARRQRLDVAPDEAMAAPAQDQHRMHVLMPLERREAAGRDLEIAQLGGERGIGEQHLPGDRTEQRAVVLLVGQLRDLVPAVVVVRAAVSRFLFPDQIRARKSSLLDLRTSMMPRLARL